MTYKKQDWQDCCLGLETAREFLERVRRSEKHLLAQAVFALWIFGEYAVNVVLELQELPIERNHNQAERARVLHQDGVLKEDYYPILEQLERYRKKAAHKGYARRKTDHYSTRDVEVATERMTRLRAEVEDLLRQAGRDLGDS